MNKNLLIGFGVFVAVIAAGLFFLKNPKPASSPVTSNTQAVPSTTPAETGVKVNEIKVSVKEFSYSPSVITVNKDEKVRITLTNNGATDHNLSIQGLGISTKTIAAGGSDSIDFTPTTTGAYTFICTVDSHKDLGLTGTLEVK